MTDLSPAGQAVLDATYNTYNPADSLALRRCDQSTVSRRLQAFRTANLAIIRRTARATYWIDPLVIS
jgi:hypothetical protein